MRSLDLFAVALLALALENWAPAQAPDASMPSTASPGLVQAPTPIAAPSAAVAMLEEFKDANVKFDVNELADILRDRRHEGWVLTAYPDPRTGQPLIGAGFSLDLPERSHPQLDPFNSHPFLEPSSADLWQAAGFDPAKLNGILTAFYGRQRSWTKRTWRRKMFDLPADITDDEAMQLVRVGAIQAIYNAQAYCRNFDQLTGPQQMAMAQLVYQMGVNLEHFSAFLAMINPGPGPRAAATDSAMYSVDAPATFEQTPEYWADVQKSLMGSQWAHKYRTRAIAVIAMLDPAYGNDPGEAERRVSAVLHPATRSRRGHGATRHVAATSSHAKGARTHRSSARAKGRKRA